MSPLPLVISLPHCSALVPPEIAPTLALSDWQVRQESDLGTAEIFGGLEVLSEVRARWCRLVVDLNRAPEDDSEGGVIARRSFGGLPVFLPGTEPDPGERGRRLSLYYWPYHMRLAQALHTDRIKVLLDGHAMDPVGPPKAPDAGQARPQVALGNRRGQTCPQPLLEALARALEAQGLEVALNHPYSGGHITGHYGRALNERGLAAVQVELNKSLFLDAQAQELIPEGLERTRQRVRAALEAFARGL